jgi:hypothetical protein
VSDSVLVLWDEAFLDYDLGPELLWDGRSTSGVQLAQYVHRAE